MSVQAKYKFLEDAYPDMLAGIGALIQKGKLAKRFSTVEVSSEELGVLEKARDLCELRIIEKWENRESEEFRALCSTYFDLSVEIPSPSEIEYLIYSKIKLISFGYLGEGWHFVRQYLKANDVDAVLPDRASDWNRRLIILCFKALVKIVQRESWEDISQAVSLINQLRQEQAEFESTYLQSVDGGSRPYGAAELISLYHFAKSIEILGQYLIEGRPVEPETQIHYHTNLSQEFSRQSGNISLTLLFQFYDALAIKMVRNTIWYTTRGVNNWITRFNTFISKQDRGVFELLYPQRESIIKGELLNPAHRAIVLNLPTSSGKTMIAEYRLLQALNQFKLRGGWVAYVVPSRALVNQVFNQLNNDLGSIEIKVEKASGAIELDGFEQHLISDRGNQTTFDVLVTTYEKLNLLVRQGLGTTPERSLVLTIVDEAHNIEEETRGLNLEFLLSTIKNDCEDANFLLMTPDITNSREIVEWLAGDRGQVINLDLDWWQPNERVVGAVQVEGRGRKYDIKLNTLHTHKGTYEIGEKIQLAHFENAEKNKSEFYGKNGSKKQLAQLLASRLLDINHPIIVLARHPGETYEIADYLYQKSAAAEPDAEIDLLKRLVQTELGASFPLAKYLDRRIAVHSSALPDEIKLLIEDLMSKGNKLQVLVATTTIAQGINFPVSSVIMGSYSYPMRTGTKNMPVRDFWNLAGRVGRAGQQEMGWVGVALKNDEDLLEVADYVRKASDDLHSQLVHAIDSALKFPNEDVDRWLFVDERWSAILQFISHLRRQTDQQSTFIAQLEQQLQGTLGYRQLPTAKKTFLRERIRRYASTLTLADAKRADETGFSTVSVRQMIGKLAGTGLTPQDWNKNQLFSEQNQSIQKLIGIMLETYEIKKSIQELNQGEALDRNSIAKLVIDWVNGKEIGTIARRFYPNEELQIAIQKTTRALYKIVANAATWGLAALQKMPTSGVDWEALSELEKKRMANLPAYLHYGVNTDEGVLMRKNNIPRSIANRLGQLYSASVGQDIFSQTSTSVTTWIDSQTNTTWDSVRPTNSRLSGEDYKKVWKKLNGLT